MILPHFLNYPFFDRPFFLKIFYANCTLVIAALNGVPILRAKAAVLAWADLKVRMYKQKMRVRGSSMEAYSINMQLESIKMKVLQITNQLSLPGKPFNIHTIKKRLE